MEGVNNVSASEGTGTQNTPNQMSPVKKTEEERARY